MVWLWILLLITAAGLPKTVKHVELEGNWLTSGRSAKILVRANSGLDFYSALWIGDLIEDPLLDKHDTDYQSYGLENWTFFHEFRLPQLSSRPTAIELTWDGIDTFCAVILNNVPLGNVNNSFLSTVWDVQKYVRLDGLNQLKLRCQSTSLVAASLARERTSRGLPNSPPDCLPFQTYNACHINLVRTAQASFGWDWGPGFNVQGFWQLPKLLLSFSSLRFGEGFKFYSSLSKRDQNNYTTWDAHASIELVRTTPGLTTERYCIRFRLDSWSPPGSTQCFDLSASSSKKTDVSIQLLRNQLGLVPWWPKGIATGPRTYTLYLELTSMGGYILDRAQHTVGFRDVEVVERLVQPSTPELGMSFYIKINGFPVFVRGANWIPSRILPGRGVGFMKNTTNRGDRMWAIKRLLRSAVAAGINLIRVWGGGRYEPNEFYTEADRLGLMIWHDMMFAVTTYPGRESPDPIESVEMEIRRQIRRLHSHPSIVVWATDNEVKQAVNDGWYSAARDKKLLKAFQDRFVYSVARTLVNEERVPNELTQGVGSLSTYRPRRCMISSPSNGLLTEAQQGLDPNPQNFLYGDVHYYVYSGNLWLEESYPVTRFTSEFGIQSLPSGLAWRRSLKDPNIIQNWDIRGSLVKHRQHHSIGDELFELAAAVIGRPSKTVTDPVTLYDRWAYITQLHQMMSYRAHINRLMRHQCRLAQSDHVPVERSSMGAAYWQLNDVWSAPSWSTIDAAGQWKMAHYGAVRECFLSRPLGRVAIHADHNQLEADWIPSHQPDRLTMVPDYFEVKCYTTESQQPVGQWKVDIDWSRHDVTCPVKVIKNSLDWIHDQCRWGRGNQNGRIVHVGVWRNGLEIDGDSFTLLDIPVNIRWPTNRGLRLTDCRQIPSPSGMASVPPFQPTHTFLLIIETKTPELFVWLEVDHAKDIDHWFEDNAFSLLGVPRQTVYLYLSTDKRVGEQEICHSVRMLSLASVREPDSH
ncbi:Beta-mannosidase [Paragonimus skrjabini miyazakii]|uniref:Mannanase n=1 Tax=Paragonimus skrjabini miyazakii TaxID=59628 RepID=A0A8S9YAC9_9TREM|nr:Beta-mannosidase [Paragonimus skrjabini miyazakii]